MKKVMKNGDQDSVISLNNQILPKKSEQSSMSITLSPLEANKETFAKKRKRKHPDTATTTSGLESSTTAFCKKIKNESNISIIKTPSATDAYKIVNLLKSPTTIKNKSIEPFCSHDHHDHHHVNKLANVQLANASSTSTTFNPITLNLLGQQFWLRSEINELPSNSRLLDPLLNSCSTDESYASKPSVQMSSSSERRNHIWSSLPSKMIQESLQCLPNDRLNSSMFLSSNIPNALHQSSDCFVVPSPFLMMQQQQQQQHHQQSPINSTLSTTKGAIPNLTNSSIHQQLQASQEKIFNQSNHFLPQQVLNFLNPSMAAIAMRPSKNSRRQRTTFTNEQTIKLEIEYRQNEYISRNKRFQLADTLQLSENQIKIWFQNRRAKDKRIEKAILDQQYRISHGTLHQLTGQQFGSIETALEMSSCTTCSVTKRHFEKFA